MIDFFKPVETAWSRMEKRLFRPFDIGKWFVLGFSAWLASFLEGSFSSFGNGNPFNQPSKNNELQEAFHKLGGEALVQGLTFWLLIVALIWVILIGGMLLFNWLGSRGQFMFLDNILHNRAEIQKPWSEFRSRGNSLFVVYAGFGVALLTLWAAFMALALVCFWPDFMEGKVQPFTAYLPWIGVALFLLLLGLIAFIALFFLKEFGVPMIYRDNSDAWSASRRIWKLGCAKPLDFLVYLFMRMVMAILFWILSFIVGCLTCCFGFLPYLHTVLTLPLRLFRVAYTLDCLAQLTRENYWPEDNSPPPPFLG